MTHRPSTHPHLLAAAAALILTLGLPSTTTAATIVSVDPGSLFGYIPLSSFGTYTITGTDVPPDGLALGFNTPEFIFAGESWTGFSIAENGFMIVGGQSGTTGPPGNQSLPDPTAPNNILAPFWTDLTVTEMRIGLLTDGVGTWLVTEWSDPKLDGGVYTFPFQVWIGLNGVEDITFAYDPLHLPPDVAATIGAEDKTGLYGDMVARVTGDLRVTTHDVPESVPEPSSILLLGTAAAGFAAREWRRRKV